MSLELFQLLEESTLEAEPMLDVASEHIGRSPAERGVEFLSFGYESSVSGPHAGVEAPWEVTEMEREGVEEFGGRLPALAPSEINVPREL